MLGNMSQMVFPWFYTAKRVSFPLGRTVMTAGVAALIEGDAGLAREVKHCLFSRHAKGDWGVLDTADVRENAFSLEHGFRLLSAYRLSDQTKIWIITEADRSVTTALLPEEY